MMMKSFIFSAVATVGLSLCNQSVQARSWRINSNPDAKANFTSINAAMESLDVFKGDTLYLDPGCSLRDQSINKAVTIIGPGYNLDGNEQEIMLDGISFGTNKVVDHAKIEGCHIGYLSISRASNLTIERCKIGSVGISHQDRPEGVSFLSCFIYNKLGNYVVFSGENNRSIIMNNCIVLGAVAKLQLSTFTNNVFISYNVGGVLLEVTNSSIKNNIIINANAGYVLGEDERPYYYKNNTIANTAVTDNNTISNNVLSTEAKYAFANYPANKFIGAAMTDVFTLTGVADAMYRLKEGSPAIGYGTNGYDCGAFSGAYPYVISGRPRFIPYIYEAVIPNHPTDGKLNVTLKIKSQNE